jgi:hypothetical protein
LGYFKPGEIMWIFKDILWFYVRKKSSSIYFSLFLQTKAIIFVTQLWPPRPQPNVYCILSGEIADTWTNNSGKEKLQDAWYRVFIWNLGKLTVYYKGLYSIIWASTWGKSLVFIGHFSRFRQNRNIKDISGSNWRFLTASP